MPPVVKFGGERGPIGINILVVQISVDGGKGDVNLYAVYSDMLKWFLFGKGIPPIYMCSKSSHIRGVKLSDQLLTTMA